MTVDPTVEGQADVPLGQAGDDRGISVGRDARGNAFVTGDRNNVRVVIYQSVVERREKEETVSKTIGPNPYVGLLAFHEVEADRFFGREEQIARLWEKLRDLQESTRQGRPRLLPILGPSGSGKSSLARAGLIPELARRPLPGWRDSRVAVLTPGSHPLEALAAVLAQVATTDIAPVRKTREFFGELKTRTDQGRCDGLRRIAAAVPEIASTPLILLVDQFEEIYSLCADADERSAFVDNILCAVTDPAAKVLAIITLRTDFLEDTQKHPQLNSVIASQGMIIPSMNEDELRRAITEPAKLAGRPLDEATVGLLINETEGRQGALPLLQFALTRIWDGLVDGVEPVDTLKKIGGVGGALAGEAQRIYDHLPDVEKNIARRVFLGLVQLGEGTRDTRRRVVIDSLIAAGEDPDQVEEVVRRFSAPGVRLITLSAESDGHETAEVTHEALFEHWRQLDEWLVSSRDDLRFQRRLDQAARHWSSQSRARGLLWRPPDLDYLRAFHQRAGKDMTDVQMAFYQTSCRAQNTRRILFTGAALWTIALAITSLGLYFHASAGWGAAEKNNEELARRKEQVEDALARLKIESKKSTAAAIMAGLRGEDYGGNPSESEFASLRHLAESEPAIRVVFLEQLLTHEGKAERLRYRYSHILHATVGLDIEMKQKVKQLLLEYGKEPSQHRAINIACAKLATLLDRDDPQLIYMSAINHLAAMRKPADSPLYDLPGEPLPILIEKLPAEQAAALAQQLVSAMEEDPGTDMFVSFADALNGLGEKLPNEQAAAGVQHVVAAMAQTTDPQVQFNLVYRLDGLAEKLSAEQAVAFAQQIEYLMYKADDPYVWLSRASALDHLWEKLTAKQAAAKAQEIVDVMKQVTDPYPLSFNARVLGGLGQQLPAGQAAAGAQQIHAALEKTTEPLTLESLGIALDRLWQVLPAEQAAAGAPHVVASMERTTDSRALVALGGALSRLGPHLPAEQAATGGQQIVAAMKRTTDPDELLYLGNALNSLGESLPAEHAAAAAQQIVPAMEGLDNWSYALPDLGSLLGSLVNWLSAEQAAALAQEIVAAIAKTPPQDASGFVADNSNVLYLSTALVGFGEKLPAEQAANLAQQIVAAMKETTNPNAVSHFAIVLDSLGQKLPTEQAAAAAQQIVAAMEQSDDLAVPLVTNRLAELSEQSSADQAAAGAQPMLVPMAVTPDDPALPYGASPLAGLCEKLPAEQAAAFAEQIVAAMKTTTNPYEYLLLARVLDSWGGKLPADQAAAQAQQIVEAMEQMSDPCELSIRACLLGSFGQKLPAEQAAAAAQPIHAALNKTDDPFQLYCLGLALDRLAEILPAEQATPGVQHVVEAMKKTTDSHALISLGRALGKMGEHLSAEQAAAAAQQILDAMKPPAVTQQMWPPTWSLEISTGSDVAAELGGALDSLGEKLPAEQAAAFAQQIVAAMQRTTDLYYAPSALGKVVEQMEADDVMSVLKSLPCVDNTRSEVLRGLEFSAETEFNDSLWKALDWAMKKGVDIEEVPRFPILEK